MRNSDEFRNPRRDAADLDRDARIDDRRRTERNLEEVKRPRDIANQQDQPLIDPDFALELQDRWDAIQATFVDQPKKAVEDANRVIEDVMKHISDSFANERSRAVRRLGSEGRENTAGPASTEDMRIALQRYKAIFTRLISV